MWTLFLLPQEFNPLLKDSEPNRTGSYQVRTELNRTLPDIVIFCLLYHVSLLDDCTVKVYAHVSFDIGRCCRKCRSNSQRSVEIPATIEGLGVKLLCHVHDPIFHRFGTASVFCKPSPVLPQGMDHGPSIWWHSDKILGEKLSCVQIYKKKAVFPLKAFTTYHQSIINLSWSTDVNCHYQQLELPMELLLSGSLKSIKCDSRSLKGMITSLWRPKMWQIANSDTYSDTMRCDCALQSPKKVKKKHTDNRIADIYSSCNWMILHA